MFFCVVFISLSVHIAAYEVKTSKICYKKKKRLKQSSEEKKWKRIIRMKIFPNKGGETTYKVEKKVLLKSIKTKKGG